MKRRQTNCEQVDDLLGAEVINKLEPVLLGNTVSTVVGLRQELPVAQAGPHGSTTRELPGFRQLFMPLNPHLSVFKVAYQDWYEGGSYPIFYE